MLSPTILETTVTLGMQSPELLFVRPFGVETDIASTAALGMAEAFRAAGNLSKFITHVTTHEPEHTEPSLGILDQTFSLETKDRHRIAALNNVRIAPMGANKDGVLVGTFPTAELGSIDDNDALKLFGGESLSGYSDFAYATMRTVDAHAGGFGFIALHGRVTVFTGRPSNAQLIGLANAESPIWATEGEGFPLSRLDTTREQATVEQSRRLAARNPV